MQLKMSSLCLTVLALAFFACCQAVHFDANSPGDGDILYICVGDTLVLPWNAVVDEGDVIEDVKWFFTDRTKHRKMIAIFASSTFLPVAPYSGRLRNANQTALLLSNVTAQNSGNFSVELDTHDKTGTPATLRRSVRVNIGDGLQTTDGKMHVTHSPKAVQNDSGHWSVPMFCGNFSYPSTPPFHVLWQLPSGDTVAGTDYMDGHFILELREPVEGGNYVCRIPNEFSGKACLRAVQSKAEAETQVDDRNVTLLLLEGQLQAMKRENAQMKDKITRLNNEKTKLKGKFDECVQSWPKFMETHSCTKLMVHKG